MLTEEQARKLLTTLRGHTLEAFFTLALATGLRRGELLGLKWQDIDVNAGMLEVRRTLSLLPTETPGNGYHAVETRPKRDSDYRSIVIAPFAFESLKRYRQQQIEMKLVEDDTWQEEQYVFSTLLGEPLSPDHITKALKSVLKQAELPDIPFHNLRHTTTRLLLEANVPVVVVQEILGYGQSNSIVDRVLPNTHIDRLDRQREAMNKLSPLENNDDGLASGREA